MVGVLVGIQASGLISCEFPGIRLQPFLTEVSKQAHIQLSCSPELENEVLVARFKDISLDELRKRLSSILHADWLSENHGWRLAQSSAQVEDERTWNSTFRRTLFDAGVKAWAKRNLGPAWTAADAKHYNDRFRAAMPRPGGPKPTETIEDIRRESPSARIASKICRVADFSKIDFGGVGPDRVILSGSGLAKIGLKPEFVRELTEQFTSEEEMLDAQFVSKGSKPEPEGPFEIIVSIENRSRVLALVEMIDKRGKVHQAEMLSARSYQVELPPEEVFRVSPTTEQTALLFGSSYYNKDAKKKYNAAQKWLETYLGGATKFDPLGMYVGQCWLDFARSQNRPLLASLEEDTLSGEMPYRCVPARVSDQVFVGMTRTDQDGWILARPQNPWRNRQLRTDRQAIETLWHVLATYEPGNIERTADLASLAARPMLYLQLMNSGRSIGGPFTVIYGTLSPELRTKARTSKLSMADLPPRGRQVLQEVWESGGLNRLVYTGPEFEASSVWYGRLYPKGLPECSFSCPISTEWVVKYDSDREEMVTTLDDLAREYNQSKEMDSDFEKSFVGRVGKREEAHPTIRLGGKEVHDEIVGPTLSFSGPLKWNQTPKEFRAALLARAKELAF